MKQPGTFAYAMTVSAGLFFAGRLVIGSGAPEVRPLAKSLGTATIQACSMKGRIESRTNGVYAVFVFENPTRDVQEIAFNYLAARTPPMSLMSRMGPRPETVKKGMLAFCLPAGNTTEEMLLKGPDPAAGHVATNKVPALAETPEIWSLVVSREEIKGMHGWGAVGPAASDAIISLDKGEAVLAVTVQEKPAK